MSRIEFARTWLFGPGADEDAHRRMLDSGADGLIFDLEDFTPPNLREQARSLLAGCLARAHHNGQLAAVRINQLQGDGTADLEAAMAAGARIVSLPMAESARQVAELESAIRAHETTLGHTLGCVDEMTSILPVCETALGVVDVRQIASASQRIRVALLGAEDLAADLAAERTAVGTELAHARARFLIDCRAARIEPIDAPYTFSDVDGAVSEARASRAMGYRSKAVVRPDHAVPLNRAFSPDVNEVETARRRIAEFEAARARGEDRALVDGHWVEVPTYRAALRVLELADRYGQ